MCKKIYGKIIILILMVCGIFMLWGCNPIEDVSTWVGGTENENRGVNPPQVSCQSGILVDMKGKVLYSINGKNKAYPASTTKILTALVALEIVDKIGADIDNLVQIPDAAVGVEGSSIYLKKGDSLSFKDLLYGAMLRSGNDAATAVAILSGGTQEAFVTKMNQKAEELGCKNSNFVNPTGLYDENHYTTAEDMAKIAIAALSNPVLAEIVGTKCWKVLDGTVEMVSYTNKNKTVYEYEGGNGIKIGYTQSTGRTLVASAKRGEKQMIAIVFGDHNWFDDAYKMMDYGFDITGE